MCMVECYPDVIDTRYSLINRETAIKHAFRERERALIRGFRHAEQTFSKTVVCKKTWRTRLKQLFQIVSRYLRKWIPQPMPLPGQCRAQHQ